MKIKPINLSAALLIFGFMANAQNKINLSEFKSVNISGISDLKIKSDTVNSIEFVGESNSNFLPQIDKGNLNLDFSKLILDTKRDIILSAKSIEKITVSGMSDVSSIGEIKASQFTIESSGSSDITLSIDAKKVISTVSGSGDVKLSGKCDELSAVVSGAGDLKAKNLNAKNVDVLVSGAGDAEVNAEISIKGKASGAGSLKYTGNPSEIQIEKTGVGSVKKIDDETLSFEIGKDGMKIDTETDTTRIKIGKRKIIIMEEGKEKVESNEYPDPDKKGKKNKKKKEIKLEAKDIWSGVEFGSNGFLVNKNSLKIPGSHEGFELDYAKSYFWNINPIERNISIYKQYVSIATGLGFEMNRYSFGNRYQLVNIPDTLVAIKTGIKYKKNVLRVNYITVPLFLEFNTSANPKHSFHFAPGIIGAYKLGSARIKQEYNLDGIDYEQKIYGDYYVNPFKLSAAFRMGYGKLNLIAAYSLSEMFSKNKTIGLTPFTLGLSLISF
jgi:hypothetical protein